MQPTYTPPIPVIGNHPAGCSCTTCVGARKRLLASPFVQGLISDLSVLHEQFYKATEKPIPAPELEARVLALTDELATAKEDSRVIKRALEQSRKISQEREKQLAEEKRLHGLSKMSDANARGTLQQIHTELGGDPDEPALTKVQKLRRECIERGVACEHNAAEVVRLAEQGRDAALEKFRVEQDAAVRHAKEVIRLGQENGALREELQRVNLQLDNRKEDCDALLSDKAELTKQLGLADGQVMAQVEQVRRVTFEGTLQTIVASVLVAVAAFLVGRWAR